MVVDGADRTLERSVDGGYCRAQYHEGLKSTTSVVYPIGAPVVRLDDVVVRVEPDHVAM